MKTSNPAATLVVLCSLFWSAGCASRGEVTASANASAQDTPVKHRTKGSFDVALKPQADAPDVGDPAIGRMSADKQFHGGLEATSKGQMLGVRTALEDSAGYVAMERVVGTLDGRTGTFVLQHSTTMNRGVPRQSITVVPDSGTADLSGLAGSMTIEITAGQHFYDFEYWFEAPPKS
jgi:hypothetical protein